MPPAEVTAPHQARKDIRPLVEHIIRRYHDVHRAEFPAAIRLARIVEAKFADEPLCPRGLADHLAVMADDLEGHQQREERHLFPTLMAGGCAVARFPIRRMMAEHEEVHDQLLALAALTQDFTASQVADETWVALYRLCRKLSVDLVEHMRLENDELFAPFLN